MAVAAIAVGVPLGIVGGRVLWRRVTESIDVTFAPRIPVAGILVVALATVALAVFVGAIAGRAAVRRNLSLP